MPPGNIRDPTVHGTELEKYNMLMETF